jgi:hypothetical protein
MREDLNLRKKYHNYLIDLFSTFWLEYNNIIKIFITINSQHFSHLKKFHVLTQNKDKSIEKEYNYNIIKNESQIRYPSEQQF